uniref:NTP transferase domain-containing protein n=1 Tax=uncultured Adlercreutzia sp. TaxID=875803 RepID=UPI0026F38249
MLSRFQFDVLRALKELGPATQRSIASSTGLSLGTINKAVKSLQDQGAISANNALTEVGEQTLRNSRVDGAVILAAGMATRLAPLSFEHPKALFQVQGEVLIERLIRQLKSANISKITVVVGHMKEQFFYLEDRFGVDLVEAPEDLNRN